MGSMCLDMNPAVSVFSQVSKCFLGKHRYLHTITPGSFIKKTALCKIDH